MAAFFSGAGAASGRAGLGTAQHAEALSRNEGRSSSPPLWVSLPSESGAPGKPRKAAAGVLQLQVSQEKEQPVYPDCPDRRKALSREMKELIIPLPHPVRPEDTE